VLAIGIVGWNLYWTWKVGPWDLPTASKPGTFGSTGDGQSPRMARPPLNTDIIVSKNLFDPERGAGATREAEENSRAFQRVRGMILVGTVIIGNNRVAILQESTSGSPANPRNPAASPAVMRLKVGDNLDGFRLTEIADRRVVFAKDASRVEVLLDYFRKVEPPAPPKPAVQVPPRPATTPVPRVVPNLPRRGQLPVPGSAAPES
jgi:hypothetical protein